MVCFLNLRPECFQHLPNVFCYFSILMSCCSFFCALALTRCFCYTVPNRTAYRFLESQFQSASGQFLQTSIFLALTFLNNSLPFHMTSLQSNNAVMIFFQQLKKQTKARQPAVPARRMGEDLRVKYDFQKFCNSQIL